MILNSVQAGVNQIVYYSDRPAVIPEQFLTDAERRAVAFLANRVECDENQIDVLAILGEHDRYHCVCAETMAYRVCGLDSLWAGELVDGPGPVIPFPIFMSIRGQDSIPACLTRRGE